MKVLFISSWYPNKLEPTNGNFVQRHAEAVALQHQVEVLHTIGDPNQKEKFLFDEKVINGLKTLIVYYRNTKNPLINFRRRMKAYKLGFQNMQKPDIVHANVMHNNMLFAVHLKKKYKIPYVVTEHWSAFQKINLHKLSKASKFVANRIAKHSSKVLPVTENLISGLRLLGIKTPMQVVGNVVDVNLFNISETPKAKFIFLHISNLIPLKNPKKIINVAIQLHQQKPNFELWIGGDGDKNMLDTIVAQNNAATFIKTFGILSLKEVSEKMQASDCFILFSDYENQPCVILESFATGLPVIASEVGGIPEIMDKDRGILVKKDDETALLAAMKNVLENEVDFKNKQEIRQYSVENFSKQKIAEKFSEVYKSILA
ncbi:glycosyltransferase [Soonwooa sp.]|uniref:glycosyltransferase n=1 Tax=Soonwooa sp. TaxID=1938592 RepID=UPI0026151C43|nr:glycosyltransferase [Soonwooa sp.]